MGSNGNAIAFLVDPLCGCTGSGAGEHCGRTIACGEDDETACHAEPIPAVSSTKRGPVPASSYEADLTDPIDVELSWHLVSTDHEALSKLMLNRLEAGEYTIEGRHVSIHWGTFGPGPCRSTELLVSEAKEDGDWDSLETPLPIYLRQALDVAASLGGHSSGAPAVARVPPNERLSFMNFPQVLRLDPDEERVASMKRACEEARLREEAVEVYERGKLAVDDVGLQRANSLATECKMPPIPDSALARQSSSMKQPQFRFPTAAQKKAQMGTAPAGAYFCSGNGPVTVGISRMPSGLPASVPPPAQFTTGIPATTRIRKV